MMERVTYGRRLMVTIVALGFNNPVARTRIVHTKRAMRGVIRVRVLPIRMVRHIPEAGEKSNFRLSSY